MDLHPLIYKLTDKLNEIGIDQYDPRIAYRDLGDAYDTIRMIATNLDVDITDTTLFPTFAVERCTIRLATYHAYRVYTRLVNRQTAPEQSSPHITAYDVVDCQNCLSLLFGTTFNEELLPIVLVHNEIPVVAGSMGPSILDVE